MVDTHCHLFKEYYNDISDVIKRSLKKDVNIIIVNGYDMISNKEVLELVTKYDNVHGTLGFYPNYISDALNEDLKWLEDNINCKKILGIGEIGLDYYYDIKDKQKQINLFKKQLDIALKYNKPVIIHSRDAIKDTYDILKEKGNKGILHCYSGSVEMAHKFNQLGIYLGVGGIITFRNAKKLCEVVKNVDLKWIVLETDSPYLTPDPFRNKKNEPCYIREICNKIAEIKGVSSKEVENITTSNVYQLFDF
ncbi:MAG: TatD family hydrolase [bacterium]|nr:TatD family hydrolase [bacterium]